MKIEYRVTQQTVELISQLFVIFKTILLELIFIGLWKHLIEPGRQIRKVVLYMLVTLSMVVLYTMELPPYSRYLPIVIFCIAYGYIFKLCRWEKPTFLFLFLYNLHTMSFLIANSVYQLLNKYVDARMDMSASDMIEKLYLSICILQIVMMASYGIIFMLLYLIFCKMNPKLEDMSLMEFIFLSVLNVVGIILAYMIVKLTVIPLDNEIFILYDEASDLLWKVPIIAVLLLIGEYSSIHIFCRHQRFLMERESVISRELGLKQLEARFEEAQMLYGNLRSLRHDIKNHIQAIQGLSNCGETKAANAYFERLNEAIEEIDGKFSTGNTLCDVILNDKYRIARKNDIEMFVDFRYDEGISDFDLGILLSNLCDNAIEACRKVAEGERYIEISFISNSLCSLLEVRNSYDGKELVLEENGLPKSSKPFSSEEHSQKYNHGMGLKNVSAITEAYLGKLQIDTSEGEFCITVMLQKRRDTCPVTT